VAGWLDWFTTTDNTNTAFVSNQKYARIAAYLSANSNLFNCPADTYISPMQRALGWSRRARSYSASLAIGPGNAQSGPWNQIYRQVTKMSELITPSPGETFLYLDEHPDSINDAGFWSPDPTILYDVPATFHNDASSVSFTDGHAELHKWQGYVAQPRARQVLFDSINTVYSPVGDADIHWLSYHTSRAGTNSF
jgi:prepilin-type processing-associated H-X9-DG protein